MLFCGDLLRKTISDEARFENKGSLDYSQFSVPLDTWLDLLLSGGEVLEETERADNVSENSPLVSIGFIQVCRNSIRSYKTPWSSLGDQSFLKQIYESAIAFYVFEACDLIDLVVPLRICLKDADPEFIPMVVSIKSEWTYQQSQAAKACAAMKKQAEETGLTKAFCLLISFGSNPRSHSFHGDIAITPTEKEQPESPKDANNSPNTSPIVGKKRRMSQNEASTSPDTGKRPGLSQNVASSTHPDTETGLPLSQQDVKSSPDSTPPDTETGLLLSQHDVKSSPDKEKEPRVSQLLLQGGIIAKAIRVPHTDVFGLTVAFRDMTPDSQVNSELFTSHSFLMAHGEGKTANPKTHVDLKAENALCAGSGSTRIFSTP